MVFPTPQILIRIKTQIAVLSSVSHPVQEAQPTQRQFTPPNDGLNSQSQSIEVATRRRPRGDRRRCGK
jgi:hypothetical protein